MTPGLLLRITTHTGAKHFSTAAMTLDPVGVAGHLVSMAVADGMDNVPTALLANHMESSMAEALGKEGSLLSVLFSSCFTARRRYVNITLCVC